MTLDNDVDVDYEYDDAGCLEYIKDGDTGTKLYKYVYDDEHRLVRVVKEPEGDNDKVVEFEYDALGRRIVKTVYADENTVDEKIRYIYDGINVIEEYVDDSGWVHEAQYVHGIGIDNVLTIERDSSRWYYHHDGLGSVTELTDGDGDLAQAYEYDAWGNMTLKEVKVDQSYVVKERYFYNYDNLIEYIWYPSGVHDNEHPHYVYDGLGRRVRIEYGTVTLDGDDFDYFTEDTTKEYVFEGVVPIIEYTNDSGRTIDRQYYWGLGLFGIGGLLYQKIPTGTPAYYYYHYDGSGNVTCITDASKEVKALYEYDAFGNVITKCGSLANDFLFSTQMANANAGWYMYMFRNYSPRLGRFTQRDPIGFAARLNLYEFCDNRPVNCVDLLGRAPFLTILLALVGGGAPAAYGASLTDVIKGTFTGLCAGAAADFIRYAWAGPLGAAGTYVAVTFAIGAALVGYGIALLVDKAIEGERQKARNAFRKWKSKHGKGDLAHQLEDELDYTVSRQQKWEF